MAVVLVVDDNESIRWGLSMLLRNSGFDARVAADGAEALDLADAARPDAVMLDVSMPGLDGLQVLAELREQYGRGLPVLMYSAVEDDYVRRQAERLGARFVPKGTTGWADLVGLIHGELVETNPAADPGTRPAAAV